MRTFLQVSVLFVLAAGLSAQTQSNLLPHGSADPVSASSTSNRSQGYDPLLDPPPLPHNKVALVGGTVTSIDRVMNRITIQPFGSKQRMAMVFDTRSGIYCDGKPATAREISPGERVYIDSMLDGTKVFAKAIRAQSAGSGGSSQGQVLQYDATSNVLTLRDELSEQPAQFRLSPSTVIRSGNQTRTASALKPGSLVSLTFATQQGSPVIRDISLLAEPGATFSFFGKLTFVDLSRRLVAIANRNDGKTYEVHLRSIPANLLRNLHEGTELGISAVFDGRQYVADNIAYSASGQSSQE